MLRRATSPPYKGVAQVAQWRSAAGCATLRQVFAPPPKVAQNGDAGRSETAGY